MHDHTLAPIDAARERVATEREQLRCERDAFEGFAERVARLDAPGTREGGIGSPRRTLVRERAPGASERLRAAYRETVMGVEHYEEVYDEPLAAHVQGELGPDVAAGMCGDGPVPEAFERALERTVDRAVERRTTFLDHLDEEMESLTDARSTLGAVTAALYDRRGDATATLESDDASIGAADEAIGAVVTERQALVHGRRPAFARVEDDLCTYLYDDVGGWTYPVLSVTASLKRDLEALERRERSNRPTGP